jgi:hypothetical protein
MERWADLFDALAREAVIFQGSACRRYFSGDQKKGQSGGIYNHSVSMIDTAERGNVSKSLRKKNFSISGCGD